MVTTCWFVRCILSNESPEILATLYAMQLPGTTTVDLNPRHLAAEADALKAVIYNQARR